MKRTTKRCCMAASCEERRRRFIEEFTWDNDVSRCVVEALRLRGYNSIYDFYDEPIYDVMRNAELDEDELIEVAVAVYREENRGWGAVFSNPFETTYRIEQEANTIAVAYDRQTDYKSCGEMTFGELLSAPFLRVQHIPYIVSLVVAANEDDDFSTEYLDTGDNDLF